MANRSERRKRTRIFNPSISALAILSALSIGNAAHAQATGANTTGAAQGAGEAISDEIVVTAQKRSESILTVPASVSVIGGDRLASQHATQLQDYAAYVPGFQVDSAGTPGQTTITLRGIAPIGPGSAVGTYIDDAPLGSSGLYALANSFQLDLLPYDLKSVEVLRGPQGTLYGASTLGGLIKYVLEPADAGKFRGSIGGDLFGVQNGDGIGGGARGMLNVPLISDTLGVRVSGFYQKTPGYVDNPVQGKKGINSLRQWGGRFALAWTPTTNFKVTLDALYQKVASDGNSVVVLDPAGQRPLLGDLTANYGLDQPFTQSTAFFQGRLAWTLPFATVTSVTSYSITRNHQVQDASPIFVNFFPAFTGAPGYAPQTVNLRLGKFTQEVRLTSPTGSMFEWMLGGFFTSEQMRNNQFVPALDQYFQPLNDVNPTLGVALNPLLIASLPTRYREEAVFGNLTWNVVGGLSVTGGLRYSHNSQHYSQVLGGLLVAGSPPLFSADSKENVTTYSVSAKYQFNPSTMLYARVASGYQPGGPNFGLPGIPPSVSSATTTNYEVGFKTRTLGRKLTLDLSLFRIDWDRMITTATTSSGIQYLDNGGTARSQGVEASAVYQASRAFSVGGTFTYTDAKFTKGVAGFGTVVGQRLPNVPRYSASLNASYETRLGDEWTADLGGGLRYNASRPNYLFIAPSPPVTFSNPAYVVVDLNARVTRGSWTVGLFAKNLLDRRAYQTKIGIPDALGGIVEVAGSVLQPRTVGLSLDHKF